MASETKFKETEIGTIPEEWNVYILNNVVEIIEVELGEDFGGVGSRKYS
ncbi:hypothetical protein [Methanosarcina siciliae]|nr:hypothetical protein [Methanosarcina siciliae]